MDDSVSNGGQDRTSAWLIDLINSQKNEFVANPPAFIARYEDKGQTVYFLPQRCCDIFSNLYDAQGNIIGHLDGGITGEGDGLVTDFFETRTDESVIWSDKRGYDSSLVQVTAPIESVEVLVMESYPVQYSLSVVSGLPNACVSYAGYQVGREDNSIVVEMLNWTPANPQIACAQVYTTVETLIPLGSEFESGETYIVVGGDATETFVAQRSDHAGSPSMRRCPVGKLFIFYVALVPLLVITGLACRIATSEGVVDSKSITGVREGTSLTVLVNRPSD